MNYKYEIPKLYGLFKNGKVAKFSDDIDNLFATWSKLRDDGHEYEVRLVAKNLTAKCLWQQRANQPRCLMPDGTQQKRSFQISAAIGDAFERARHSCTTKSTGLAIGNGKLKSASTK